MRVRRNLALGAVLAIALVVPTLTSGAFSTASASSENSLARLAEARSWAEVQVLSSIQTLSAGIADWISREAAKL